MAKVKKPPLAKDGTRLARRSSEFHDGEGNDAEIHNELLRNRRVDLIHQSRAIRRAMERGMSEKDAWKYYGNLSEE